MGTKRVGWARIKSLINENTNEMHFRRGAFDKGTATVSLTTKQSGKTIIVGPLAAGLAADTVFTLPTAAAGLHYRFVYVGGAADAQDFQINTGSDTNFFIGGVHQHDIGGEDGAAYHPNLSSNSKVNFLTPDAGTWAEVYCDGTNWFLSAFLSSATNTAVTWADQ
jgi:hypothetical protein